MKDKNITPGQMRFVWRFMETRFLVAVSLTVGLLAGFTVGVLA